MYGNKKWYSTTPRVRGAHLSKGIIPFSHFSFFTNIAYFTGPMDPLRPERFFQRAITHSRLYKISKHREPSNITDTYFLYF